jgi:hypothetical protein
MTARGACTLVLLVVTGVLVPGAVGVAAQTASEPTGRLHIGVGAGWLGGAALGEQPADLRAPSGGPYRLFNSETDLRPTGSFEARLGVDLTRRFGVEGRAAINKPELRTVVSSDAETTGSFTIVEGIDQYVFDGGILFRFDMWAGLTPFASAGAGYIRQLHDQQELVETGLLYYVGGAFTHALFSRPQGVIRALSVRADLRLNVFSMELDENSRAQGSVSGSLILTF